MKTLLLRCGFCLLVLGFCLYSYVETQNEVTQLKIELPKVDQEIRLIREETKRLVYEIERLQSPANLMELARRPEFSHLQHPMLKEILTVPEALAAN